MSPPTDYGQTAYARRNREDKAERIVAAALERHLGPRDLRPGVMERRTVRRAAGVDRDPSDETWALVLAMLADAVERTCLGCLQPVERVRDPRTRLVTVVDPPRRPGGVRRLHVRSCDEPDLAAEVRARQVPPCRACRGQLDAGLYEADGLDAHASCAPGW